MAPKVHMLVLFALMGFGRILVIPDTSQFFFSIARPRTCRPPIILLNLFGSAFMLNWPPARLGTLMATCQPLRSLHSDPNFAQIDRAPEPIREENSAFLKSGGPSHSLEKRLNPLEVFAWHLRMRSSPTNRKNYDSHR